MHEWTKEQASVDTIDDSVTMFLERQQVDQIYSLFSVNIGTISLR